MEDNSGESRGDVIKHSAAIQIQNNITLLQRKAWNVLLANAYDKLLTEPVHRMPISNLCRILEFNSKNAEYLKESLRAMVGCRVEWNLLGKDDAHEWGTAALLAEAVIKDGMCFYSYGPMFRERLHRPNIYARVSLSLQNEFESKHAQALWELCTDYLGAKREYGETGWITIEDFRLLMGLGVTQYSQFMRLNSKVIKPAIAEINTVSDLCVTIDYQRVGRKVSALKLKIRKQMLLAANQQQPDLFPDLKDMPVLVYELTQTGLSYEDSFALWQQGWAVVEGTRPPAAFVDDPEAAFTEYLREKIDLLKRRKNQGKVKNATGFLLKAIKLNYANPEYSEDMTNNAVKNDEMKKSNKKKELLAKQVCLEEEYEQQLSDLCEHIAHDDSVLLERIMQEILEVPFNRSLYNARKSSIENYLNTQGLRSLINERIMEEYAKRFKAIREEYEKQVVALEQQIEGAGSLL